MRPSRRTWWEAATTTGIALRRYELRSNQEGPGGVSPLLGAASFWDMQPLAAAVSLFTKLGFQTEDHGTVFRRP